MPAATHAQADSAPALGGQSVRPLATLSLTEPGLALRVNTEPQALGLRTAGGPTGPCRGGPGGAVARGNGLGPWRPPDSGWSRPAKAWASAGAGGRGRQCQACHSVCVCVYVCAAVCAAVCVCVHARARARVRACAPVLGLSLIISASVTVYQ